MSEARSVQNRELLLDDEVRETLRRKVDPLITRALNTRGYTEERNPIGRVYLDTTGVMPSNEYLTVFNRVGFDALSTTTAHYVTQSERLLTRSTTELNTIGGLAVAKIVGIGEKYSVDFISTIDKDQSASFDAIDPGVLSEIMQDIRAHTQLGYSSEDKIVPAAEVIEELSTLHSGQNVDRYAHYQVLADTPYGDIQMNIGESFEIKRSEVGGKMHEHRINAKKIFELVASQPLEEGSVTLGVRYASGRKQSEVKLTAEIVGTTFSDKKKQALYDEMITDFQHRDPNKFGSSVVQNLTRIIDTSSDIYRLG